MMKTPGSAGIHACLLRSVSYCRKPAVQGWAALPGDSGGTNYSVEGVNKLILLVSTSISTSRAEKSHLPSFFTAETSTLPDFFGPETGMLTSAFPDDSLTFIRPLINHPGSIGSPNSRMTAGFDLVLAIAS